MQRRSNVAVFRDSRENQVSSQNIFGKGARKDIHRVFVCVCFHFDTVLGKSVINDNRKKNYMSYSYFNNNRP